MEQRLPGTMGVCGEPFVRLRMPKLFNLRTDPERADFTSNSYYEWFLYHAYILFGTFALADKFAAKFRNFPPVKRPGSFTIDDALKAMNASGGSGGR